MSLSVDFGMRTSHTDRSTRLLTYLTNLIYNLDQHVRCIITGPDLSRLFVDCVSEQFPAGACSAQPGVVTDNPRAQNKRQDLNVYMHIRIFLLSAAGSVPGRDGPILF
jgi:hypothetical protein